jgi:acyl-CoA thioester hydrolase
MAIKKKLALMALKAGPAAAAFMRREVSRLEFLNQPTAVAVRSAAIQAAGNLCRPLLNLALDLQVDFPAVIDPRGTTLLQNARVQLRAEAQAMPAFAAAEANARKTVVLRQFADGNLKRLCCRIKFQTSQFIMAGKRRTSPHTVKSPDLHPINFSARIKRVAASVFQYQHRVIYGDCTVGNHVYYARYLDMLERARGEFFRHLGCPFLSLQEAATIFPVIGLEISYKGLARYDDLLTIETCVSEMGGIRLSFGFRILNAAGALLAEGQTRHVCAGTDEKPKRLPKELIEKLQPFVRPSGNAS